MQNKKFGNLSFSRNNIPGQIRVISDRHDSWLVKVFGAGEYQPSIYADPNRRDYYKILLVTEGCGQLSVGSCLYEINAPTVIFLHPQDIISWNVAKLDRLTASAMYIRESAMQQATLKTLIDNCRFFEAGSSRIFPLSLLTDRVVLADYFSRLQTISAKEGALEFLTGYLQLLLVEIRQRCPSRLGGVTVLTSTPIQIYQFFELLHKETAQLSTAHPMRIKTAKEFANELSIHPNYLNALVKKYTGQNISTQIRTRLVEESRTLLLQTNWTVKEISDTVGFSDPPNFTFFFKKYTGHTPVEYRRLARSI